MPSPIHHAVWLTALHAAYTFVHSKWGLVTGAVSGTAAVAKAWPPIWEKYEKFRDFRSLKQRIGADLYTQQDLIWATRYYIEPECQPTDPAGQEDFRKLAPLRTPAHKALANLLDQHSDQRFMILLADSGMGKTTLLMNLYAKYGRKKSNYFLIPLGRPDADELIKKVRHKTDSILFLDAFDEDTKAIKDYKTRLAELVELSKDFSRVVMTCRTQFFETDAEIPQETGIIRIGSVSAGRAKSYTFSKLYLSPFSEKQIHKYLEKRFPFWKRRDRKAAREMVEGAADLTMRPMLLSYIPELVKKEAQFTTASELYEAMTDAWFERESSFVDPVALKDFSTALAVDIFCKREARGSESVSGSEALLIAQALAVPLHAWQFRGRSLLNRTADGRLKFSHRSLLEYFFVLGFLKAKAADVAKTTWTDQVKRFWWEGVREEFHADLNIGEARGYTRLAKRVLDARSSGDVTKMSHLGLTPFVPNVAAKIESVLLHPERKDQLVTLLLEKADELRRIVGMPFESKGEVVVDLMRGSSWLKLEGPLGHEEIDKVFTGDGRVRSDAVIPWRIPTLLGIEALLPIGFPLNGDVYPADLFRDGLSSIWASGPDGLRMCRFNVETTEWLMSEPGESKCDVYLFSEYRLHSKMIKLGDQHLTNY